MLISLFNYWECRHTHKYIYIYIYMANGVSEYKLLDRNVLRRMEWKRKIDTIYNFEVMQLLGHNNEKWFSGKMEKRHVTVLGDYLGVESRYGRRGKIGGLQGSAALILALLLNKRFT